MKCPYCGEENTKVIDSRPAEENNAISSLTTNEPYAVFL